MHKEETTLDDVLDAVNKGFTEMQIQFEGNKADIIDLKTDVSGLKADVGGLKADVGGLKADVTELKQRVTKIEATMVTKDYLDDKLSSNRGKINVLVDVLRQNKTISDDQRIIVNSQTF